MPNKNQSLKLSLAIKLMDLKEKIKNFGDYIHKFDRALAKRVLIRKRRIRNASLIKNISIE